MFYGIAFYGIWDWQDLVQVATLEYALKVLWETLATPLTYALVNFLKKAEQEDFYDIHTRFNPFSLDP